MYGIGEESVGQILYKLCKNVLLAELSLIKSKRCYNLVNKCYFFNNAFNITFLESIKKG